MPDAIPLFERINSQSTANSVSGQVRWSAAKSLWWTGLCLFWLVFGTLYFSWGAVAIFLASTSIVLCLGHSLGMHRKLIHQSFDSSPKVETVLVYLGTLVGLGGPFTMMFTHDIRDWAQRNTACHPFLSHQSGILKDYWWQLHCKLHLDDEPEFCFPRAMRGNKFYVWLEKTSWLQQLPWAVLFFATGGIGWIAWGIAGRITISIFGHWLIGYFAHNKGQRDYEIKGASVQGFNIPYAGLFTFGECWHNNHHAFPGSAKLGLGKSQLDPSWFVLKLMASCGWVQNLRQPKDLDFRPELEVL